MRQQILSRTFIKSENEIPFRFHLNLKINIKKINTRSSVNIVYKKKKKCGLRLTTDFDYIMSRDGLILWLIPKQTIYFLNVNW